MLIDEHLLTLTDATKLLPHRPHVSTLWRWTRGGVRGVRLEHVRMGARVLTSREALDRFSRRLAELDEQERADTGNGRKPARPRSNREREEAIVRAERECEAVAGGSGESPRTACSAKGARHQEGTA